MADQNTKLNCICTKDLRVETVILYEHGGRQNVVVADIGFALI